MKSTGTLQTLCRQASATPNLNRVENIAVSTFMWGALVFIVFERSLGDIVLGF